MITKSGIDTKNFEFESAGLVSEELLLSYTAKNPTGLYVLENANGMEVCITNLGGRIVSVMVPDKFGNMQDVVLGFDSLKGYIDYEQRHDNFQGALIGRYANRISGGSFELNGNTYKLPINNDPNCLHGGPYGWSYQSFEVLEYNKQDAMLKLQLVSPDGDMGFPGKVNLEVMYKLQNDNSLHIIYEATSDADTVINVTNHSYFNLSGDHSQTVLDHKLFINSRKMTPIDENSCPTGEIVEIEKDSPFDFYRKGFIWPKYYRDGKPLAQDINADDAQIKLGNGYDHNFVLQNLEESRKANVLPYGDKVPLCAKAFCEQSGIMLQIYTTEPGVQLYDSVDLDGHLIGKNGVPLGSNCGLCLETQHFADSPNHSNFPSTILKKDEVFNSASIYKFIVKDD